MTDQHIYTFSCFFHMAYSMRKVRMKFDRDAIFYFCKIYTFSISRKESSFVVLIERMYVCGFVALCVRMSIAGANEVEGTMSWCLGTIEILASKHDIAQGQTRVLWDRHLDCSQFLHLLWRIKVIRSIRLKYLHDSNAAYSDVAV